MLPYIINGLLIGLIAGYYLGMEKGHRMAKTLADAQTAGAQALSDVNAAANRSTKAIANAGANGVDLQPLVDQFVTISQTANAIAPDPVTPPPVPSM